MRNILLILGENERGEQFSFLSNFAEAHTYITNSFAEAENLLLAHKFSVIASFNLEPKSVQSIKNQYPYASFFLLLKANSSLPFQALLDLSFDDEMEFDGSELNQKLLLLKLSRLLQERWHKKLLGLFNALLTSYPNAVVTTRSIGNKNPKAVFFNEAFLSRSGFKYAEIIDKPIDLLSYYSVDLENDKLENGKGYLKMAFVHGEENSASKYYDVHITPVMFPNSHNVEYMVAIENERVVDHSKVLDLEEKVDLATKKMKSQTEFLASVAHDIRKPLNNIIGLVDLFKETALNKEQEFINNSLGQSSRNLKSLVNDLLDITKMESGSFEIVNQFFNIRKFMAGLDIMFRKEAEAKGIEFSYLVDENVPALLEGDENRISQIMVNLIGNALKFTDQGLVKVKVDLLSINDVQARVKFDITDTGIGIKKEDQQRIFNSFEQAKTNDVQKYGGTGLGLTICQRLCNLMHGKLTVKSEWRAGSVFSMELPFKLAPLFVENHENNQQKDLGEMEILVIDDSSLTNFVLDKLLSKWNANVSVATTGKEGFELFKKRNFDVIITDIQLPDMNGMRLSVRLKEVAKQKLIKVPIIGISAFPYPSKQIAHNQLDDFLLKPLNSDELYEKIIHLSNHLADLPTESNNAEFMTYQIIDTNRIKTFANNDLDFIKQLIEIFLKRTPEYMDELRMAIEKRDWSNIKMLAHKLKPTFTYVGMEKFTGKVGSIEDFALKQDLNSINMVMDEVWEDCQLAFHEFDDFLKSLD